ncbi:MAG TPA: FHA domain-containing protein [Chloroflexi bacterium]|nr:FHA domain-containing protein [Chloroflexota bacterium]
METIVGRRLAQYKIEAVVGTGSVGAVYRVEDVNLRRPCALKLLHPAIVRQPEMQRRLQHSVKNVSRLSHAAIAPLYDYGRKNGRAYIASAFIPGISLRHLLDALAARRQSLQLDEILHLAAQIAEGLACAHQRRLIHQDLHPGNVLIKRLDRPARPDEPALQATLTDFGLSVVPSGGLQTTPLGDMSRSLPYLAPEQCVGDRLDGRTDIYSLGVILYQMIAGQPPFPIQKPSDAIRCHMLEEPVSLRVLCPGLPTAVADIAAQAMAKAPDGRFQTAAQMAAALRQAATRLTSADIHLFAPQQTVISLTDHITEMGRGTAAKPKTPPVVNGRPRQSRPSPEPQTPVYQARASDVAAPVLPGRSSPISASRLNAGTVKMPLPAPAAQQERSTTRAASYGRITITQPGHTPRQFTLSQTRLIIGRRSASDIALSDLSVSRRHAELRRVDGRWQVRDLGSSGGTVVDGRKLTPQQPVPWLPGQTLRIGAYTLHWAGATPPTRLSAGGERLSVNGNRFPVDDERLLGGTERSDCVGEARQTAVSRFSLTVWPHRLPGAGICRVLVQNEGDLPDEYTALLRDESGRLRITQPHGRIRLEPGESNTVRCLIRPRRRPFTGVARQHPFIIEVRNRAGVVMRDTAVLQNRPVLSVGQFLGVLFVLFLFLLVLFAILWLFLRY